MFLCYIFYNILLIAHFVKNLHATHARGIFLDGRIEMGNKVTDVCIFVKEKEHLTLKDSDENIIQWLTNKPSNWSKINYFI